MAKGKASEIRKAYNSEAFRSKIESTLADSFNERWGRREEAGEKVPLLVEVKDITMKFLLTRPNGISKYQVDLWVVYVVDYHGIYALRRHEFQFELDADEPADVIADRIREKEPELVRTIKAGISQLPDVYPAEFIPLSVPAQPFFEVSFLFTRGDYRREGEVYFHELLNQIFRNKDVIGPVVHNVLTHAEKTVDKLQAKPKNAIPIAGVGMGIRHSPFAKFSDFIEVQYTLKFDNDNRNYILCQKVALPDFFPLFREKNADAKDEMVTLIQNAIISAFDYRIGCLPSFYLDIPILQPVVDAFHSDGIKFSKICAICTPSLSPKTIVTFFPGKGDLVGVDVWANGWVEKGVDMFSLSEVEKKLQAPVQMDSRTGFPESPIYFLNFCKEASVLYDQFAEEHKLDMPNLTFRYKKGRGYICSCMGKELPFLGGFGLGEVYEKDVRGRLWELFEAIAKPEDVSIEDSEKQAEILSTLNPTELLILQKVVENGRSWKSKISRDIDGKVLTLKSDMQAHIKHLCETHVSQSGTRLPLLTFKFATSARGHYQVYYSPVSWSRGVLRNAVPKPFTLNDFRYLTTKGKEVVIASEAKTCQGEEDRMNVLHAWKHMTVQSAASFAKSGEGEEFLRTLDGELAVCARAFLESLPGCKRVIVKCFPES